MSLDKNNSNPKGRGRRVGEVSYAGGKASSSKQPDMTLLSTVALERLAKICELGIQRKGKLAWNAVSENQEVIEDRKFILSRISHVINHALRLRDKIMKNEADMGEDDAASIMWGGMFLCAVTDGMGFKEDIRMESVGEKLEV